MSAGLVYSRSLAPGHDIFRQGEAADKIWFLGDGATRDLVSPFVCLVLSSAALALSVGSSTPSAQRWHLGPSKYQLRRHRLQVGRLHHPTGSLRFAGHVYSLKVYITGICHHVATKTATHSMELNIRTELSNLAICPISGMYLT